MGSRPIRLWRQVTGLVSYGQVNTLVSLLRNSRGQAQATGEHLRLAMRWLCRAQDATGTGGVSYGYGLLEGWWPPYPETTGYCIPTFLRHAQRTQDEQFRERARAMARWELIVQAEDGGIPGGALHPREKRPGVAFDTGQVLQGWAAMYRATREERFLAAAERAGNWLIRQQSTNGRFHDQGAGAEFSPRAYNARTSWALLELNEITQRNEYRRAAQRNLEWTLNCQASNGWFRETAFVPGRPALTHTIAYVLEGLVGSWRHLQDKRLLDGARRCAEAIKNQLNLRGWLPATFDSNWESQDSYSCVTGCAQMALVWLQLFQITGRRDFYEAALRMNHWLKSLQIQAVSMPDVQGGIPGSYPIYGSYERMRLPNWAAKFFADAMLAERDLGSEVHA